MDINIDFELYKILYNVVKYGNISKAAEMMYITQPAVSQSIKKLEEQLGGNIFNRTTKGVVLTSEGKQLYEYIKECIEKLENAPEKFNQYNNLETGKLRIKTGSLAGKIFMYDAVNEFIRRYPNINIEISDGITSKNLRELAQGDIDIVSLNLPCDINDDRIEIKPISKIHEIFYASKKYSEKINADKFISCKEIENIPIVIPKKLSVSRILFDKLCYENNINFSRTYDTSSLDVAKSIV